MNRTFYVYMMASKTKVIYIGFTNSLMQRVFQHKTHLNSGFTSRYNCHKLVYCEEFKYVLNALARERQLKNWRRAKKIELIVSTNPDWNDLACDWHNMPNGVNGGDLSARSR